MDQISFNIAMRKWLSSCTVFDRGSMIVPFSCPFFVIFFVCRLQKEADLGSAMELFGGKSCVMNVFFFSSFFVIFGVCVL